MKALSAINDKPFALAMFRNYTRLSFITCAFIPKDKEFWICLDTHHGVFGYLRFQTPEDLDFQRDIIKAELLGYAELIGVYPAGFSVPDSADVYTLFLPLQQGEI